MVNIYSKEGIMIIAQVDHLSGEIMGSIFDMLYDAGAQNVQCIQTLTKKNRPGNIFLIDTSSAKVEEIEKLIVDELDSTGWHRFTTEHRHIPVEFVKKDVEVKHLQTSFKFLLIGKRVKNNINSIKPEHSNCVELKDRLKLEAGIDVSLKLIYSKVQMALLKDDFSIDM